MDARCKPMLGPRLFHVHIQGQFPFWYGIRARAAGPQTVICPTRRVTDVAVSHKPDVAKREYVLKY